MVTVGRGVSLSEVACAEHTVMVRCQGLVTSIVRARSAPVVLWQINALESLVIASFVRGLSVRDIAAALAEALGDQATISKSTVSAICAQIKAQFSRSCPSRKVGIGRQILCVR